jgi:N-acetylneuraminic acid mutarotase
MKRYYNKNNRLLYLFSIAIVIIICSAFFACYDNFDNAIKDENTNNNGTTENNLPVISFASSVSSTPNEDAVFHAIDIILSQASGNTVTVTVTDLKTGSAAYGVDYNYTGWSSPQVVTFNPGDTKKTIYITPVQDNIYEGSGKTINLQLSLPTNAVLGAFIHTMTITDDDSPSSGWTQVGNVATSRAGSAAALSGNYLYIYGGETSSGILNEFLQYDLSTGNYTTLSSAPGTRAYATLSELNGKLYLFGGEIDTSGTLYNDKNNGVYYYDITSSTWSSFKGSDTTGTFPGTRAYHVAVPIYNSSGPVENIYLHGGDTLDDILHKIDLTTSKYRWQTPQYKISYTRSKHSAVNYNNNIYFFGGYYGTTYYNDLWKFDTTSTNFIQVVSTGTTIIPVRSGISMIEYNGNIYVFGGQNGTACLDDLWSYSLSGNTWAKISTAPFKRCFYSAVQYNNSLIIFGGYYLNGSGQKVYSSDIWQYKL